jgi:hypothetical protein
MDVLTFGGDGPACIHVPVLVGFASRHVCPNNSRNCNSPIHFNR